MANPYQPVPGVLQVRMQYSYAGENAENIFHVWNGSTVLWGTAQIEDVLSTFENWEDTQASQHRPSSAVLVNMIGTDLTSLGGLRKTRPVVPQIAGGLAQDGLPNNATVAVKADIGNRGRGKQGRIFWIGLAESRVNSNEITIPQRDGILSVMAALIAAVQALNNQYRLVTVHRVENGIRPPTASTSNIQGYELADLTVDSQYARLPHHRRRKRSTT